MGIIESYEVTPTINMLVKKDLSNQKIIEELNRLYIKANKYWLEKTKGKYGLSIFTGWAKLNELIHKDHLDRLELYMIIYTVLEHVYEEDDSGVYENAALAIIRQLKDE